jgi:sec-independent protein translocase protein TatB
LVVLGPERLPKVARQVGTWMGHARVMARQLTEQLEREVSADEFLKAQTKAKELVNRIAAPLTESPQAAAALHSPTEGPQAAAPLHSPGESPRSAAAPVPPPSSGEPMIQRPLTGAAPQQLAPQTELQVAPPNGAPDSPLTAAQPQPSISHLTPSAHTSTLPNE